MNDRQRFETPPDDEDSCIRAFGCILFFILAAIVGLFAWWFNYHQWTKDRNVACAAALGFVIVGLLIFFRGGNNGEPKKSIG